MHSLAMRCCFCIRGRRRRCSGMLGFCMLIHPLDSKRDDIHEGVGDAFWQCSVHGSLVTNNSTIYLTLERFAHILFNSNLSSFSLNHDVICGVDEPKTQPPSVSASLTSAVENSITYSHCRRCSKHFAITSAWT